MLSDELFSKYIEVSTRIRDFQRVPWLKRLGPSRESVHAPFL
jgi:hypothetical protein